LTLWSGFQLAFIMADFSAVSERMKKRKIIPNKISNNMFVNRLSSLVLGV
jgi:hypothetical protein